MRSPSERPSVFAGFFLLEVGVGKSTAFDASADVGGLAFASNGRDVLGARVAGRGVRKKRRSLFSLAA